MSATSLPPKHMSYSQLSTYKTCSEQYRLEKLEKVPSIPSWALPGGSAVHAASEDLDWALFDPTHEVHDFQWHFEREIAEQVERCGFGTEDWHISGRASKAWPNKEGRDFWEHSGPGFVAAWVRWREACGMNIWVTPDAEPAIELALEPTFGEVPVKMFIDRIFITAMGDLVVVDLKSGSRTPDTADQLGTYAAGVEDRYGVRPAYGMYWMARTGGSSDIHHLGQFSTERLTYEYGTARKGIEAGVFLPKPSALCNSCGVKRMCYTRSIVPDHRPFGKGQS